MSQTHQGNDPSLSPDTPEKAMIEENADEYGSEQNTVYGVIAGEMAEDFYKQNMKSHYDEEELEELKSEEQEKVFNRTKAFLNGQKQAGELGGLHLIAVEESELPDVYESVPSSSVGKIRNERLVGVFTLEKSY